MTIHQRIRQAREKLGISQAELARRVGVSTQAVQQWEEDPAGGKATAPRRATRKKVAEVLGVTLLRLEYGDDLPAYLFEEQTPPAPMREGSGAGYAISRGLHDVPIIGFAVGNPDEDGYFDDMGFPPGAGEAYIPWPTRDPNAYALWVKNDSMAPRIRAGEKIVVEPGSQVSPGDDVLVRTHKGRKMVKQLLFRRGNEVTLGSVNIAYPQLTMSIEEIETMHFIAGIVPRGARTKEES